MPTSPWIVLAVAAVVGGHGSAQQVRVRFGGVLQDPAPKAGSPADADDPGTPVEMFENSNLDRYLRNAQAFLDRQNYAAAIKVLQDVVEERTLEVVAARPEDEAADGGASGAAPGAPKPNEGKAATDQPSAAQPSGRKPAAGDAPNQGGRSRPSERDSRNAVYSQDGRIYRPVRRLCHELLARMPAEAIELYRATYEVAAEELLQTALRDGSLTALEQVGNRYFVTLAAGRAMALLGDRLMQEGRYRAAAAVFRDLLETYPAGARQRLGINTVWCRFKVAVCLRQAGEAGSALAAIQQLAAASPDESLRVQGELQAVKDLPESGMFAIASAAASPTVTKISNSAADSWLAADTDQLVPLWQYRFRNPEPYKDPKGSNDNNGWVIDSVESTTRMPFASRYGPGTRVTFGQDAGALGGFPRALFLEHFCLRSADAATGVLLRQGRRSEKETAEDPPVARENQPRIRIAASDFALLRPVEDEVRRYVVLGRASSAASTEVLKASEVVAFDRELGKPAWSSAQWLDGDSGLREVTFLAAPVVFGERLLLPALRRGAYSLECLDRRDGRPLWNVMIHAGGSPFFKAPGCQVVVQGGIALVATNAGCIAAVDAFAGDLRWVRRYERVDPQRKSARRPKRNNDDGMRFGVPQYPQGELTSFLPNDLVVHEGVALVAPCDGDLLVATDVSTGQMLWYVDAATHYGPYGRLLTMIGTDGQDVFLASATHVVAIGLSGGLIKWAADLPQWNGSQQAGRGRGCLIGEHVVLPGQGNLLVCHTSGKGGVRSLKLPAFDSSREPLAGPFHVTSQGPWLAIGYPGGVEMFSTVQALQQLAARTDEPLAKATLLTQAGDFVGAEAAVVQALRATGANKANAHRRELGELLLQLVATRAKGIAAQDVAKALAAFDACKELLRDREQLVRWHLARLEMCKAIGDLQAHEREQQALYACMEGKS